jgi:hypothetical protein
LDARGDYLSADWTILARSFRKRSNSYLKPKVKNMKSGDNKGKISLTLPKADIGDKSSRFKIFKNDNGFDLLRLYSPA